MMKLTTMLKVDGEVDKEGRSLVVENLLERWEHETWSAELFRASANFVYVFRKGDEYYFLRFSESSSIPCIHAGIY